MVQYSFNRLGDFLQKFGFLDFILPFILVFTIVFAVLEKTKILGEKKNFNVVVALVMGLLFVVPHIVGSYPLGYDPVLVLNATLPSISLVGVASIMLLVLLGVFGTDFAKASAPLIAVVGIIFVVYIFGAALQLWSGPWDAFSWWSSEVTELIIIIIVFGLIVFFIVREPDRSKGSPLLKWVKENFEKRF